MNKIMIHTRTNFGGWLFAVVMIFVLSSCSDDTQETPDWREELYPSYRPVWVGEGLPPVGDNFERFGPGINIKKLKRNGLTVFGSCRECAWQ